MITYPSFRKNDTDTEGCWVFPAPSKTADYVNSSTEMTNIFPQARTAKQFILTPKWPHIDYLSA